MSFPFLDLRPFEFFVSPFMEEEKKRESLFTIFDTIIKTKNKIKIVEIVLNWYKEEGNWSLEVI